MSGPAAVVVKLPSACDGEVVASQLAHLLQGTVLLSTAVRASWLAGLPFSSPVLSRVSWLVHSMPVLRTEFTCTEQLLVVEVP